ncbi:hypothetical protein E0H46_30385 [Rhizobium leguminosarum bv. viciae]|nr:hypothetical protein E0H46_30385 [Rhizobium leguminosarum bv. viciae]
MENNEMTEISRALPACFVPVVACLWVGMTIPALADECNIPKASIQVGDPVVANGVSSLRSTAPRGAFGLLGGEVGVTQDNKEYIVDGKKCVRIVGFGRQLWLHLKGLGWGLSGSDDAPYQYFRPQN